MSTDGGEEPVWSAGGHELFYRNGNEMLVVAIETVPVFSRERAQHVFEADYDADPRRGLNYDVSPDGQRFLMVSSTQESAPTETNVVVNWFEELTERVPVA